MACPACRAAAPIVTHNRNGRRSYHCPDCGHQWQTVEVDAARWERWLANHAQAQAWIDQARVRGA